MAITITSFTADRCRQDGTVDNTGTYLNVVLSFTATGTNVRYAVRMKDTDTGTETAIVSGTGNNRTYISSTAILNSEKAYHVYLIAYDGISIKTESVFIPKTFVLIDFNASGKGIGIGKISDHPNELAIGMDMFDRYDTRILNGIAFYESGGSTDPDTCIEEMFLTNIAALGGMTFVKQLFYGSKTTNANRTQIAFPYAYNSNGSMVGHRRSNFRRHYNGSAGGWSAWVEEPVVIESGESGIWTYRKYSDGTAECFGKINISGIAVSGTLGNWFRSETLYADTEYPYPITFSEAPATEMMFQTRNSSAALLWIFSSSAENVKVYLPQCYLIRPVTSTGCNGNINIIAKGKI